MPSTEADTASVNPLRSRNLTSQTVSTMSPKPPVDSGGLRKTGEENLSAASHWETGTWNQKSRAINHLGRREFGNLRLKKPFEF